MTVVNPKIILTQSQWNEIKYYVAECPMEISGMGNVIIDKDGNFRVTKLAMLEQEVSGASTDIDPTAIAKLMGELRNEEGSLSFWWHSHVNMSAFFSGTDEATILEHGKNGYCIALVMNKQGEYKTAYCQKMPFLKIDDMQLTIVSDASPERLELMRRLDDLEQAEFDACKLVWDAEYKAKVKLKSYGYPNGYGHETAWDSERYRNGMMFDDDGYYVPRHEIHQTGRLLGMRETIRPEKKKMSKKERAKYQKLYVEFYGYVPVTQKDLEDFFMDFNDIEEGDFHGNTKTPTSDKTARPNPSRNPR